MLNSAEHEKSFITSGPVLSVFRYKEYSVIKTTQDTVHKLVEEKINECSHWQQVHKVSEKARDSVLCDKDNPRYSTQVGEGED